MLGGTEFPMLSSLFSLYTLLFAHVLTSVVCLIESDLLIGAILIHLLSFTCELGLTFMQPL